MSLAARRELTMVILRDKEIAMASESGQPVKRGMGKRGLKASDVKLLKEFECENSRFGMLLGWRPSDRRS